MENVGEAKLESFNKLLTQCAERQNKEVKGPKEDADNKKIESSKEKVEGVFEALNVAFESIDKFQNGNACDKVAAVVDVTVSALSLIEIFEVCSSPCAVPLTVATEIIKGVLSIVSKILGDNGKKEPSPMDVMKTLLKRHYMIKGKKK